MFARYVRYDLRLGSRSTFETWANEIASLYRGREGFRGLTVLAENATGEYAVLTLWETKEAAEAAGSVLPDAQQWLDRTLRGPPVVRIYEVYAHDAVPAS
ncbi:MAG: antibiotic biosynthesis monooxygenase family protein [Dehalococcoidia bacterium]